MLHTIWQPNTSPWSHSSPDITMEQQHQFLFADLCTDRTYPYRFNECNPANGDFGFHRFYNRERLLPYSDLLYYEVGNLNTTGSLPDYVTEYYTRHSDNSNTDRIIVSFHARWRRFENIYVTQHCDQTNFDQNHTYRISIKLIKDIQELSREKFLIEPTNCSEHVSTSIYQPVQNNTSQSTSSELMKNHEDVLREPTNCSEHVNLVFQSTRGETCRSVSSELIEDVEESNCEDFRSEPMNRSEQFSTDIPQSAQRETCQSQPTCGKCCPILRYALFTVIVITVIAWIFRNTMKTQNYLSDLRETKFGQPRPRHGLNLLWWFANDCVQIDSNGRMTARCNPANGEFGFHRFYNGCRLLPYTNLLYYERLRTDADPLYALVRRRMPRLRTLNELAHLRDTEFGQGYPRHGLILLWWFADECIEFDDDGNMIPRYNPKRRNFGFHPFHNSEGILPDTGLPYYEIGNLHNPGKMPHYVTKNYDSDVRESNADRIVVSVGSDCDGKWLDRIYVTHHLGQGRFDVNSTYRISKGLIEIIQNMEWSDFIGEVKI
ncbi:hypothetical protein Q8A67_005134 [Cirrhinus molitorella]|uniref:Uncharacterized protein n=1 Tax=Cirrhinus molitorella TaxID=172907 RepID=A0AA88QBS3_9TELE|nr:hypothetical protein Q8A67_005134 [Cirrhinus molitorella]